MNSTMKRTWRHPTLLVLFISLGLTACSHEDNDVINIPHPTTHVSNHLKVTWQDVPIRYMTSGTVTSDHRVSISTRLSGYIRDISVRAGDRIQKGQVLVHIDPVNAKQVLIQAKADLHNAKVELQRYQSLLKQGAVSTQQFDKIKLRYKVKTSQVKQAKHQLSYAKIISPVHGVVVKKLMSQGDLASPGMPILTIEDPSSLLVKTYVSERFVSQIHEGNHVDIRIPSLKQHFSGVVRQVVQAADPISHQFLVKISLPSSASIHPGMYAQSNFQTGTRQALFIPQSAISEQAGLQAVYIMDSSGMAHYRLIRTGEKYQGKVEILAGLNAGDHVIWHGQPRLKNNMKVQL